MAKTKTGLEPPTSVLTADVPTICASHLLFYIMHAYAVMLVVDYSFHFVIGSWILGRIGDDRSNLAFRLEIVLRIYIFFFGLHRNK